MLVTYRTAHRCQICICYFDLHGIKFNLVRIYVAHKATIVLI